MKNKISLFKMFTSLFIINSFTFGGGYTIIPIIKDEFVDKLKAIDEDDMNTCISIAQSAPGAMAISASFLVGYKIRGLKGAFIALLASSLPCVFIITLISYAYVQFITNIYIKGALSGIATMVSAVLFITVYKMFINLIKSNKKFFYLSIFISTLILKKFTHIHIAAIILFTAICGLIYNFSEEKK